MINIQKLLFSISLFKVKDLQNNLIMKKKYLLNVFIKKKAVIKIREVFLKYRMNFSELLNENNIN